MKHLKQIDLNNSLLDLNLTTMMEFIYFFQNASTQLQNLKQDK